MPISSITQHRILCGRTCNHEHNFIGGAAGQSAFVEAGRSHPDLRVNICAQEFQPWVKWLIFDALLTLAIGTLLRRYKGLRPALEALGLV